jgi:hypothetical protein
VPHVDISVSPPSSSWISPLERWTTAVVDATEACLVIDDHEQIRAISPALRTILGLKLDVVGQKLRDVVDFLDFAAGAGDLNSVEANKLAPLLALNTGRLARGLIRAKVGPDSCTLDAIATPIVQAGTTTGSLTFFSPV